MKFPITEVLPDLMKALDARTRLVLEAPPGAGKTTQVPLALLASPWLGTKKILMLEPRRIAARMAAEFMAAQLSEPVGCQVGYRIRFESKVSSRTRIEVVTEGILTRLIQADAELPDIGAIIFDEFHERHLSADLGAALALEIQASLRPDLRLIIMSATLDGERVALWFDAPRITSAGRSYPVRVEYPAALPKEAWDFHLRRVVENAITQDPGDLLVFLPGRREIERARSVLATLPQTLRSVDESSGAGMEAPRGVEIEIAALHGELSVAEQHAALRPARAGTRRIVLATNVAESSVTLPGIGVVVDLGLAREPQFDPNSGFTRLQSVPISQASADQRAGRAGRVAAGVAYRLWPQSQRLAPARRAEITQVELSTLALELVAWGSANLPWLDAPPSGALASAHELLRLLGAEETTGHISALGRRMLATGAAPRLAAAALRAPAALAALACDLIALMEARNPLRGELGRSDDFRLRHAALVAMRERNGARNHSADRAALASIDQSAQSWRRRLGHPTAPMRGDTGIDQVTIGNVLLHAFVDRVARQDPTNPRRYGLSNGRGARLHEQSDLYGEPWLIALDLRLEDRDCLILSAAPFDPGLLESDYGASFTRQRNVRFNPDTRNVEAFDTVRFGQLLVERRSVAPQSDESLTALLAAIREAGIAALPWSEDAEQLRSRVRFLHASCPEIPLPDLSDAALLDSLESWLGPLLEGRTSLEYINAENLSQALRRLLDYAQTSALALYAPATLRVPSGSDRALIYAGTDAPILAVKLQELFGLAETPSVAKGRVMVMLHLLSPAQRPIQVTQDLHGFWQRTYPEVRKELKGRYPRHPWPDDPWTATPSARAKPRVR